MAEDEPTAEELAAHRDDGYRALGRYISVFSDLVAQMRSYMEWRIRRPGDPPGVAEVVFGSATADQISSAFFATCRLIFEHDEVEAVAATRLRGMVREGDGAIPFRNKIAHGDWHIGYWSRTGPDNGEATPPVPVAPMVFTVRALRSAGVFERLDVNLDEKSDEVEHLTRLIREYGRVCFRRHGRQLAGEALRVRDVLILEDGVPALGPKALPF